MPINDLEGNSKANARAWKTLEFIAIYKMPDQTLDIMQKRGSWPISRVLSWTIIPLGASSPMRSSNLPVSRAGRASGHLFGLASSGVCRTGLLPDSWCALTAPFHPYLISIAPVAVGLGARCWSLAHPTRVRPTTAGWCERAIGGLLSVALSVGSRRPGVTWHSAL